MYLRREYRVLFYLLPSKQFSMKKILSLLLVSLFIGATVNAQQAVDIGFKAGLSIPNLTSGSTANPINSGYGSRFGPDASVQVEVHISKHFSIQPQVEYSSQGGKKDGVQAFAVPADMVPLFPPGEVPPYLYASYKSEAKINYLMLPILAKYRFDLGKRLGAYAAVGPFASLVLTAKNITSGTSNIYLDEQETQPLTPEPQPFDNKEKIKDELHPFNAGISGHVGVDYQMARGSVFIEGGGNYGLIDIQKGDANGKNKTGAAVINLGYQFRICQGR
jgi:hypothetical protein